MKKPGGTRSSAIPGGTLDDDLQSMLADINATVLDLEKRLGNAKSGKKDKSVSACSVPTPPEIDSVPLLDSTLPEANPAEPSAISSPSQAEEQETSLLAELERELTLRSEDTSDSPDWIAQAQRVHSTLEQVFKFFNAFAHQANKLNPEISRSYRFDSQTVYSNLRWRGAFADYRRESIHENARLAHVAFRVRLIAPEPVPVVRRWNQLDSLQQELNVFNLHPLEELPRTVKPQQEHVKLLLAPDFTVQMKFQGNYKAGCINVICSNLEEFGATAFVLETDKVTPKLLDDIGRFLLCRSNTLPTALQRILYRSQT